MVVGAKMAIQHVPSKGRISIMKIQNFTVHKRKSVIKIIYGALLIVIATVMVAIDPINLVTEWYTRIEDGTFVFNMWEKPTYKVYAEVWAYNYTNVPEFLSGEEKVLRVQEVGPFLFEELRTNENMTVNYETGSLSMRPMTRLEFLPNRSYGRLEDIQMTMPNVALIALSTLASDNLGYFANSGAYFSMKMLGSQLFRNMTVQELFWGYKDPLVTLANSILPGWIDFSKIGILDRFYAQRYETFEVELRNRTKMYTINKWNDSPGILEQGFKDMNTSNLCNKIQGTYEGLMLSPGISKDAIIPIYRRQACRIYPFVYRDEKQHEYGFNYYRYKMVKSAFNVTSPYACDCHTNCLPDGFIDVSKCYYGFPVALSKPHFLDVDPEQLANFDGMHPDTEKHTSVLEVEPSIGIPMALASKIQVNIAVRSSSANPLTMPLNKKVMPIIWLSLYCTNPPPEVMTLLKVRFVIAPPLVITIEVLLFIVGLLLGMQGFHRIWKPKYKLIEPTNTKSNIERRMSAVIENIGFQNDEELAKQAVSLLSISEEYDVPDLIINDT